jgi:hypothetical protein
MNYQQRHICNDSEIIFDSSIKSL